MPALSPLDATPVPHLADLEPDPQQGIGLSRLCYSSGALSRDEGQL